jgi:hypothetical protein
VLVKEEMGHEDRYAGNRLGSAFGVDHLRDPGDGMTWEQLTGRRVRVDGEIAHVVHVDLLRVVLMTEPREGLPAHRLVVSQDDGIDLEVLDEQGEDCA